MQDQSCTELETEKTVLQSHHMSNLKHTAARSRAGPSFMPHRQTTGHISWQNWHGGLGWILGQTWVKALGENPGSKPWVKALGQGPGSQPWVKTLGQNPTPDHLDLTRPFEDMLWV
jgi:hypothetical protein